MKFQLHCKVCPKLPEGSRQIRTIKKAVTLGEHQNVLCGISLVAAIHEIFMLKPLNEEYFGSTFSSSDKGFLVLMSVSEGLSQNPNATCSI